MSKHVLAALAATLCLVAMPNTQRQSLDLIPIPRRITPGTGSFGVDAQTGIAVSDSSDGELGWLAALAAEILGVEGVHAPAGEGGTVRLVIAPEVMDGHGEGYRLTVGQDAITLEAAAHAGLFYGLQTLRQLIPLEGARRVPTVTIEDAPRFPYRGMHLDVGRHFFPADFVKRYIDLMARYKFNTFHWHLTEDQGWRIEIDRYPRLTTVGSHRRETVVEQHFDPYIGDRTPHGGFYSQDEIRDVVAYAALRYVTVIPEIEMPGHSQAALAAYPELGCTDGPFEVSTRWGVHEDIYCPHERTFEFLEHVLREVVALFPGRYIHIGGDEAPKARWEESAEAQEVIRREGLENEHELQSWFIRRIERFLQAHGRRLIGWDEILEGGLAPEATVMSWRGMDGGIEAARQGHDVIMTPTSHVYFDYYQGDPAFEPFAIGGFTPLENVYAFEPVPDTLTPSEARHILGAQANVWTEYIKTPDHVEYMAFPRALALGEVVWSPKDARDWEGFLRRLPSQLRRLDALDVNYRVPGVGGLETDMEVEGESVTVTLQSPLPHGVIRYTTDGTDPTVASLAYDRPFSIAVTDTGTVVTARLFLPNGRVSPAAAARFRMGDRGDR